MNLGSHEMYKKLETGFGSTECNFEMDGNKWDIENLKMEFGWAFYQNMLICVYFNNARHGCKRLMEAAEALWIVTTLCCWNGPTSFVWIPHVVHPEPVSIIKVKEC